MLEFGQKSRITVRFLELMRVGPVFQTHSARYFSESEILRKIGAHFRFTPLGRSPSGTASYFELASGGVFGIIANHSSPFCEGCDRLRMDHKGRISGCLCSTNFRDFSNSDSALETLAGAINEKRKVFSGIPDSLSLIGG